MDCKSPEDAMDDIFGNGDVPVPLTPAEMIALAGRLQDQIHRQHCDLCEKTFTHFVISKDSVRYRCEDHLATP